MIQSTQVSNVEEGWSTQGDGSRRVSRHFATKKATEADGRQVSFNRKTVLVIHRQDKTPQPSDDQDKLTPPPTAKG